MRSLLITIAGITLSLGAIQDSASAQDCSPITSQQKYRELTREEATNCGAELFRGLSQRREGDLSERFYLRAHCHALDATALRRIAEHYINGEPAGRAGKILRKAPLQDRIFRVTVEILPSSPLGREQSLGPFELIRYQGKFRWFDAPVLDSVCTPDNPGTSRTEILPRTPI
jgi:hypothetical protein